MPGMYGRPGQIGLAKAMKKYDLRRTITFHSRVKRASDFARSMPEVLAWMPPRQRPKGALWADFASGEMSARQLPPPARRTGAVHPRRVVHRSP